MTRNYRDYHTFHWYFVIHPRNYRSLLPYQLLPSVLFLCLAYFAARHLDLSQQQLQPGLITPLLISFSTLVIIVFDLMWYYLQKNRGDRLLHYSIDQAGIALNDHLIPYHSIPRSQLERLLHFSFTQSPFTFRIGLKRFTLHFPSQATHQQAINTFRYYLEHNSSIDK